MDCVIPLSSAQDIDRMPKANTLTPHDDPHEDCSRRSSLYPVTREVSNWDSRPSEAENPETVSLDSSQASLMKALYRQYRSENTAVWGELGYNAQYPEDSGNANFTEEFPEEEPIGHHCKAPWMKSHLVNLQHAPPLDVEHGSLDIWTRSTNETPPREDEEVRRSQTQPGAQHVDGPGETRSEMDRIESVDTRSIPPTTLTANSTPEITAIPLDEAYLEATVRRQILDDAVQADVVKVGSRKMPLVCGAVLVVIILTVGLSVGLTTRDTGEMSDTARDPILEDVCKTKDANATVLLQCSCFNQVVDVSSDVLEAYNSIVEATGMSNGTHHSQSVFNSTMGASVACDPENLAAWWIAEESSQRTESDLSQSTLLQRYSLATLFLATSGRSWTENEDWLTEASECVWFGVSCNSEDEVTQVTLPNNNLSGTVPNRIASITSMRSIELNDNILTGSLPSEWLENLLMLEQFDVRNNQLVGPLPEVVNVTEVIAQGLSFLEDNPNVTLEDILLDPRIVGFRRTVISLRFSNNMFTGTIPSGHLFLSTLRDYRLDDNRISGSFGISPLLSLVLPIFPNFPLVDPGLLEGALFTEMEYFDISNNSVTGTIPSFVFRYDDLEHVDVSHNGYIGTIPTEAGNLEDVEYLDFSHNQFEGTIPTEILNLAQLRFLDTRGNHLVGPLPDVCELLFLEAPLIDCDGPLAEDCSCCDCNRTF